MREYLGVHDRTQHPGRTEQRVADESLDPMAWFQAAVAVHDSQGVAVTCPRPRAPRRTEGDRPCKPGEVSINRALPGAHITDRVVLAGDEHDVVILCVREVTQLGDLRVNHRPVSPQQRHGARPILGTCAHDGGWVELAVPSVMTYDSDRFR
jgi:hypothetical protein